MRRVAIVIGGFIGVVLLAALTGMLLPVGHTAAVRTTIALPPELVYDVIADVRAAPLWRSGLDSVEILEYANGALRWREHGRFGAVTLRREAADPPHRLVGRIDDESAAFGGTWTYELEPIGGSTRLTITEDGEVYSPVFRIMSRLIFGYYRTLEVYARDLGRRFGQDVSIERVH